MSLYVQLTLFTILPYTTLFRSDVTETEPLPADSPLWDAPNLLLTPHAAGGRPVGADELISVNLAALRDGRELRNVVRSEEHTSELQSRQYLVCRILLEKKNM